VAQEAFIPGLRAKISRTRWDVKHRAQDNLTDVDLSVTVFKKCPFPV